MRRHELLLLPENLIWAWRKVQREYRGTEALYNHAEIAAFELCLEDELKSIRSDFEASTYTLSPIKLVPQPKKPRIGQLPRLRQFFQVSVRDQVAWTAMVNVIGPELDYIMPTWSYGHRLYRAAWYEEPSQEEGKPSKLNIGPYRHSGGHLYRRFKHSWPLFRRHISLTARLMVNGKLEESELDFGEQAAFIQSRDAGYLSPGYWPIHKKGDPNLFTASFDLKQFYPSVPNRSILNSLKCFSKGLDQDVCVLNILERMLDFRVDDTTHLYKSVRDAIEPQIENTILDGIPTGLFVAGFLSNVAMLAIDKRVEDLLASKHRIAHFRFVDDHQVLAYTFQELTDWISRYKALLCELDIGPEIAPDKYSPSELQFVITPSPTMDGEEHQRAVAVAESESAIDGMKPTKLMTKTLALVSTLAAADFDLLNDLGRKQRMEQLEWLLLANIPEQEIKGATRAAFAASKIAHLTPDLFTANAKLLADRRKLAPLEETKVLIKSDRPHTLPIKEEETLDSRINELRESISQAEQTETASWTITLRRNFYLLFEAFASNPEKIRLFTRLFDYCHWTGFDGLQTIADWIAEATDESDSRFPSRCYFGAMALHKLATQVLVASASVHKTDILHRDAQAAIKFLKAVCGLEAIAFAPKQSLCTPYQDFQRDALQAFAAALLLGAEEVRSLPHGLQKSLRDQAGRILEGKSDLSIQSLATSTGWPIGVWLHWQLATTGSYHEKAPPHWQDLSDLHDTDDVRDWNNLRRYPSELPAKAWKALRTRASQLPLDDAGWLYDVAISKPQSFAKLKAKRDLVAAVRKALSKRNRRIRLIDWLAQPRILDNDPRYSEWTALEIIRQILDKLTEVGSDADVLDYLHPANILLHRDWLRIDHEKVGGALSWESWRRIAKRQQVQVQLRGGLSDYRYSEVLQVEERSWPRRLRSLGQLLWGILRRSFRLPAPWNIRGQERSLMGLVIRDLERLPISSCTLTILQSTLRPRSRETSFFSRFPELFSETPGVSDTEFDLMIHGPSHLVEVIEKSQKLLLRSQLTLLEHQPRQLIPVHLHQIASIANMAQADDSELEGEDS